MFEFQNRFLSVVGINVRLNVVAFFQEEREGLRTSVESSNFI